MTAFTFDTSGVVAPPKGGWTHPMQRSRLASLSWSDLSPFVQGFVEGLFASLKQTGFGPVLPFGDGTDLLVGFSDLSPDALALILRDCTNALKMRDYGWSDTREDGRAFYDQRQAGTWRAGSYYNFPPLRPFLTDEGKIGLEVAS